MPFCEMLKTENSAIVLHDAIRSKKLNIRKRGGKKSKTFVTVYEQLSVWGLESTAMTNQLSKWIVNRVRVKSLS